MVLFMSQSFNIFYSYFVVGKAERIISGQDLSFSLSNFSFSTQKALAMQKKLIPERMGKEAASSSGKPSPRQLPRAPKHCTDGHC